MCHFNLIVSFLIIALHQHLLEEESTDMADFHFYPDPSLCFDWGAHTNLTNTQGLSPASPVSLGTGPIDGTMPCPSVTFWFWPWSFQPSNDFLHRVGWRNLQNTVHKSGEISQWQNPHELRPLGNCVFVRACLLAQNRSCGHSCLLQYCTGQYSLCSSTVHILQLP